MSNADMQTGIREEAARLLAEGRVDAVVGFEEGSLPMRAAPCFVSDPDGADRLVWNAFCSNNLSRYLRGSDRRLGVVAKGCDTRSIVELIKERQVARDSVVVIGVPCRGMADPRLLSDKAGPGRITSVEEAGDDLVISANGGTITVRLDEVLHRSCAVCVRRNPVLSDVLVGEGVPERPGDSFGDVAELSSRDAGDRWEHFSDEMSRCIRCYACRSACPMCYCTRCFVDDTGPRWVGRGTGVGDVLSFHLMRVMHLAGRCVECGACERACPMDIDLAALNRKSCADVERLFGYRAGLSPDAPAPLSAFDPGDPQDFMLEPGQG